MPMKPPDPNAPGGETMTKRASTTVRYETRTTIDRPISDVFTRLADLDGYRTWMRRTGLFRRSGQTSDALPAQERLTSTPPGWARSAVK